MITFTDAWRRATIHPNGTMTILAHKTSSIGWTVVPPAPTRIVHIDAGNLEFQPAGAHQVAALANLGQQLLQEIDAYRPGFLWTSSPAEIVGALIEETAASIADATAPAEQHQQHWEHGVLMAAAIVVACHDMPVIAGSIIGELGLSKADCSSLDDFDKTALRKVQGERNRTIAMTGLDISQAEGAAQ